VTIALIMRPASAYSIFVFLSGRVNMTRPFYRKASDRLAPVSPGSLRARQGG
jgi:hypothetical protein